MQQFAQKQCVMKTVTKAFFFQNSRSCFPLSFQILRAVKCSGGAALLPSPTEPWSTGTLAFPGTAYTQPCQRWRFRLWFLCIAQLQRMRMKWGIFGVSLLSQTVVFSFFFFFFCKVMLQVIKSSEDRILVRNGRCMQPPPTSAEISRGA